MATTMKMNKQTLKRAYTLRLGTRFLLSGTYFRLRVSAWRDRSWEEVVNWDLVHLADFSGDALNMATTQHPGPC